ncbi:MAG: hypothetical protein NW703_13540 [Nitrospiraceae bacterium]
MSTPILIILFGRMAQLVRTEGGWELYLLGNEGKKRRVQEFAASPTMCEAEVLGYLDDLYHEWASEAHPHVIKIEST